MKNDDLCEKKKVGILVWIDFFFFTFVSEVQHLNYVVLLVLSAVACWWSWNLGSPSRETLASGFWFQVFRIMSACWCVYRKCVRGLSNLNMLAKRDACTFSISKHQADFFFSLCSPHSAPYLLCKQCQSKQQSAHAYINAITIFPPLHISSELPFSSRSLGLYEEKKKKKKVQYCATTLNTKPHTGLPGWMTHTQLCACYTCTSVYVCVHL